MSIEVGGINLVNSALNTEFRIGVLERLVDRLYRTLAQMNPAVALVSEAELAAIREEVLKDLQKRYPDAGIKTETRPRQGSGLMG